MSPGQRAAINPNATATSSASPSPSTWMLARVEEERLEGGRAVIRAQEEERAGSRRTSTTRSTRR